MHHALPKLGDLDTGLCVLSIQDFFGCMFFDAFPHRIASAALVMAIYTTWQFNVTDVRIFKYE